MAEYNVKLSSEVSWEVCVNADSEQAAMMEAEDMSPTDSDAQVTDCINEAHHATKTPSSK